jgi:hypothetical protein
LFKSAKQISWRVGICSAIVGQRRDILLTRDGNALMYLLRIAISSPIRCVWSRCVCSIPAKTEASRQTPDSEIKWAACHKLNSRPIRSIMLNCLIKETEDVRAFLCISLVGLGQRGEGRLSRRIPMW